MAPVARKRGSADDMGKPERKRPATIYVMCPNCNRRVGSSNFVLCTSCDRRVHLRCTQLTTEDTENETPAYTNLKCSICAPPDDSDEEMDAHPGEDAQAPLAMDAGGFNAILKELRALRQANKRLESQVSLLSEKVEKLSGMRTDSQARGRQKRRHSRSTSRRLSASTRQRSSSVVSFRSGTYSNSKQHRPTPREKFNMAAAQRGSTAAALNTERAKQTGRRRRIVRVEHVTCDARSQNGVEPQQQPGAHGRGPPLPVARLQMQRREVFVTKLDKGVSAERMHKYLRDNAISAQCVRKVQPRFSNYASFIITLSHIDYSKIFNEAIWAKGTVIMDFRRGNHNLSITESYPTQA